jgi:trimethylamine:corrinoid methyltransferase-like protein
MRTVLQGYYEALTQLQNPGAPVQFGVIDTAANLLAQAPAANYPNAAIVVTDKNCIAVSTNVAGTWTWLRADGTAL